MNGGRALVDGRQLSADVTPVGQSERYFTVDLRVSSTDSARPLLGSVVFYLHDSFLDPVETVEVVEGIAWLRLVAYGAFTVGAVADDGRTLLELDLAQDRRFPRAFRDA